MNSQQTKSHVDRFWESTVLPTLSEYIRIPNQSPLFDPDWETNGHMMKAATLIKAWVEQQKIPNSKLTLHQGPGKTPLLTLEVAGDLPGTVLLYGHMDKQPAMVGWEEGLDPWTPVLRNGRLYGRGGADDGYATFAAVSAIKALEEQKIPHSRLFLLIEACEESGSIDLPGYVEQLAPQIGNPDLVICLDSGCGNYDQLWTTSSLRGSIVGNLTVEVLTEGVHSGDASGIVPSTFRIMRVLLDRLENSTTGDIIPEWLYVDIPPLRIEEAKRTAEILGDAIYNKFPFTNGTRPVSTDRLELLLNRTWRPAIEIVGQAGIPDVLQGGNVLRPVTTFKLSLRVPPTLDADEASDRLTELLTSDPPYGAKVTFEAEKGGSGWEAPAVAEWLQKSVDAASTSYFGKPSAALAEGGSIPFMGMLGEKFPEAQFLITGVLGPHSNAHGPNEFLEIQTAKNLSACVAQVLADYAAKK